MISLVRALGRRILAKMDYALVSNQALHAYDKGSHPVPPPPVPEEAAKYLDHDNPRLEELRTRYAALKVDASAHSLWSREYVRSQIKLQKFRAQSAYVWTFKELPRPTQFKYFLYAQRALACSPEIVKAIDEDGAFSALCYEFQTTGRISRDRLDSIIELDFLNRHMQLLSLPGLRVLDIGAGYGRLAHRTSQLVPTLEKYVCLDAIPESTFLAEFYTRHRGLGERVRVVPLDELAAMQDGALGAFDIAFNVHSFSECTYAAIRWWLDRVKQLEIPYLFIVPNTSTHFLTTEIDGSRKDFMPLIEAAGYQLAAQEPLFDNPDVRKLISIQDHLFLFKRS